MSNSIEHYCHNCGKKILATSRFCNFCGTSQLSLSEKPPVEQPKQPIQNRAQFTPRLARGGDDDYIDDESATCLADLGINVSSVASIDAEVKGFELVRGEKVEGLINEGTRTVESVVGTAPKAKKKKAEYSNAAWQSLKPTNRLGGITDTQTALKVFQEESSLSKKPIEVGGE